MIIVAFAFLLSTDNFAQKEKPGKVHGLKGEVKPKTMQEQIDSLETDLSKAIEDTNKVNILNDIASKKYSYAPDECITLGEQALALSEQLQWQKGKATAFRMIGMGYSVKSDNDKALSFFEQSLKIFEKINDKKGISSALGNIGIVYTNISNYPKALEYYEKALKIAEEIGDKNRIGICLGNMGIVYQYLSNYTKALEYYEKDLKIAEEIGVKNGIGIILGNIGNVYLSLSNYPKALEYYEKTLNIVEEIGIKNIIGIILGNIGNVYLSLSNYPKALEYYEKTLNIVEEIGDKRNIGTCLGQIGIVYLSLSNYPKALEYYEKALKIAEEIGDKNSIGSHLGNIGKVYCSLSYYPKALEYYEKALKIAEEIGDKSSQYNNKAQIGGLHLSIALDTLKPASDSLKKENLRLALSFTRTALDGFKEIKAEDNIRECETNLSKIYEAMGDYKSAITHFKESQILKDSIFSGENQKKIAQLEAKRENEVKQKEIELLKKDNQIQELDIAQKSQQMNLLKKNQEIQSLELSKRSNDLSLLQKDKELTELDLKQKNIESESSAKEISLLNKNKDYDQVVRSSLIGVLSFIFLIFVLVLFFLWRKRKDNKLLKIKNETIEIEREKSDSLLHNILPPPIALRLKEGESTIADHFDEASVIFLDISHFTHLSKDSSPEKVVGVLNKIYTEFDKIAEKHGLEKIKTIGDCYMAASGVPTQRDDHAEAAALFAIEAMKVAQMTETSMFSDKHEGKILFRCGIDCGPIVGGVIGEKKFIYDLWGDTVNTASRMEEYGEPGRIQVTERFFRKLYSGNGELISGVESLGIGYGVLGMEEKKVIIYSKTKFRFEERGEIEIKGKGKMRTYFMS
jgi:tetratricopeptide (TPR) repeat protein